MSGYTQGDVVWCDEHGGCVLRVAPCAGVDAWWHGVVYERLRSSV